MKVALLHPGEMGAAIGAVLVAAGHSVTWASHRRSEATRLRAETAGLTDVGTVEALAESGETVLSICPPDAAAAVASEVAATGFHGSFVDANAIAPATAREIAATVETAGASYVDGGIVGLAPDTKSGPRLFLSGASAGSVASLFEATVVTPLILDEDPFSASQLKMSYGTWTKGSAALLLTVAESARRAGLGAALAAEWMRSQPELAAELRRAEGMAKRNGWRWVGEMEEAARSLDDLGLPDGFGRAAARAFADRDDQASAA